MNCKETEIDLPLPIIQSISEFCYRTLSTPTSIPDAEHLLIQINAEIQNIQAQMSARRNETQGRRFPAGEWQQYMEWRASAEKAKAVKINQAAIIKAWIKEARALISPIPVRANYIEKKIDVLTSDVKELKDLLLVLTKKAG